MTQTLTEPYRKGTVALKVNTVPVSLKIGKLLPPCPEGPYLLLEGGRASRRCYPLPAAKWPVSLDSKLPGLGRKVPTIPRYQVR